MESSNKRPKILVIGGGAAGCMSAIAAAINGAEVYLYEKNEKIGKKIYITGKGRCNVTNACEPEDFFEHIVSNSKFMYSAYYGFDNNSVMDMFEENGCKLKVERGNRVFPESDHSSDIIKTLVKCLEKYGVNVKLNTPVISIITENDRAVGIRLKDGKTVRGDRVIVATGGLSYASTGSTGDGHKWLDGMGHNIIECRPALVPFEVMEDDYLDLQGLALKNVGVKLYPEVLDKDINTKKNKKLKPVYEGFGEMLFTHFGLSGPLIISASSYYSKKVSGKQVTLEIDLKPALTYEQLDKRIRRDFENNLNKSLKNALAGLLPSKLLPKVLEYSGVSMDKLVHDVLKEERENIVHALKEYRFIVTGTRAFNEAIITQGGISTKDINPGTMESKKIENLFVAGELLDVDALTGGYNLQVAWSTGYLAGLSAATK